MAIGKSAMILVCFMIAAVAIVSIFSIAHKDKSTDVYYTDENNTINQTTAMTEGLSSAVAGSTLSLVLVVAILFLASVLLIFAKKK